MSDQRVLVAFLAATVAVAAGSAWAASDSSSTNAVAETTAIKDFGRLSADGSRAFQDVLLARLAIYDGRTADAKRLADEAASVFAKAKGDDTVFMKAEDGLMTSQQAATRGANAQSAPAASPAPAAELAKKDQIAWLPVDGTMSLNEDYTMSPTKAKAVADANKSLAKGDRQGAMNALKLASVDTSVVVEVVPVDGTISDAEKAAQLIDAGKYYEGSQTLRHLQTAARYDVTDIIGTPKQPTSTAPSAALAKDPPRAP